MSCHPSGLLCYTVIHFWPLGVFVVVVWLWGLVTRWGARHPQEDC